MAPDALSSEFVQIAEPPPSRRARQAIDRAATQASSTAEDATSRQDRILKAEAARKKLVELISQPPGGRNLVRRKVEPSRMAEEFAAAMFRLPSDEQLLKWATRNACRRVKANPDFSPLEKLVHEVVATKASLGKHHCWLLAEQICFGLGVDKKDPICRALHRLADKGEIYLAKVDQRLVAVPALLPGDLDSSIIRELIDVERAIGAANISHPYKEALRIFEQARAHGDPRNEAIGNEPRPEIDAEVPVPKNGTGVTLPSRKR